MDVKQALYRAVGFAWMGLVVGAWVAVDQGLTEPWLSFAAVPGGSVGGMGAVIVLTLAGWIVVGKRNERHEQAVWERVGREAGLRPAGDREDANGPALTGTVDGRSVTAWYDKRKLGGAGESSGRYVTFTFGEVALSSPATDGVVVGPVGGELDAGVGTFQFDDMADTVSAAEGLVAVESGDLVLVGTSAEAVETVTDGLSGDALRAIADLQIASIGDASGVVDRWATARNEEFEDSIFGFPVENLVDRVPGDAATVTVETKAEFRDGDVLRRFAEGLVAIADGFEEAATRE